MLWIGYELYTPHVTTLCILHTNVYGFAELSSSFFATYKATVQCVCVCIQPYFLCH